MTQLLRRNSSEPDPTIVLNGRHCNSLDGIVGKNDYWNDAKAIN